jgi:sulfatase maturation enzyme AslB (radical SAM superfamily)
MKDLMGDCDFVYQFLGLFKFLTVIDQSDVELGLEYVESTAKSLTDYKEYKADVERFMEYFRKQWMREKVIPLWNYTGHDEWQEEM